MDTVSAVSVPTLVKLELIMLLAKVFPVRVLALGFPTPATCFQSKFVPSVARTLPAFPDDGGSALPYNSVKFVLIFMPAVRSVSPLPSLAAVPVFINCCVILLSLIECYIVAVECSCAAVKSCG